MNRLEQISDLWMNVMDRYQLDLVPLADYSAIVPANDWPSWAIQLRRTIDSLNINSPDFDLKANEVDALLAARRAA